MVPTSTKDVCATVRPRKRVMSPMESTPTMGQKSSSKKKKTLREAMSVLRITTAHTASASPRQLNEDLLELRLAHLHVAHDHALSVELTQEVGQPLLGAVYRTFRPAVRGLAHAQNARRLRQPRHGSRLQAEGDDVLDADGALELGGGPRFENLAALDEGDLVAQLVRLAHVMRGEDDGHPLLTTQARHVLAHAHGDVGIEA